MTTGVGLLLILIGMIAGLGIILWLFTHDVGKCKVDDTPFTVINTMTGRYTEELPPDEILERYVMHRDRY